MPELEQGGTVTTGATATEQSGNQGAVKQEEQQHEQVVEKTPEELALEAEQAAAAEAERVSKLTPEELELEKVAKEKAEADKKAADEQARKVDMQTRVREALQKAKDEAFERVKAEERVAALEKQFAEMQAQREVKKPFVELTLQEVENTINGYDAQIAELESAGRNIEARMLARKRDKYIDFVEENEEKRKVFEKEQTETLKKEQTATVKLEKLKEASEYYREQRQIPKDVWDNAGIWLDNYFKENPLKGREFAELIETQGAIRAFGWAEDLVSRHFSAQIEKEREEKEKGKSVNLSGTAGGVTPKEAKPETTAEYIARREKEEAASRGGKK